MNTIVSSPDNRRNKSTYVALFLALLFGPLGLLYLSWKRAVVLLLLFVVGVCFFPDEALVVVGLWLILPASSVLAISMVPRRRKNPPEGNNERDDGALQQGTLGID
jgi:hypothetical protein